MEEIKTIQGRGRRKRIAVVLAACVLVAIGVVAFWPGEREPEYGRKKLSEWLEVCREHPYSDRERSAAEGAVQNIGTNALSWLVRWMNQDMPAWQEKLIQSKYRQYVPKPVMLYFIKPVVQYRHAEVGFRVLGTAAGPAAPEVARILDNWPKRSGLHALDALSCLGADGFTPLYSVATNRAKPLELRRAAMWSIGTLGSLGTNEVWGVRAMLPYVTDEQMAESTAVALGTLRLLPDVCVPALRKATDSKSPEVRVWTVVALGRFGRDAEQAIPELTRALVDSDPRVRREANFSLDMITADTSATNGTKRF